MIELGKTQKLVVDRETANGIYLREENGDSDKSVLLPNKEVPQDINIGDEIEVFIYKDSEDRIIATTKKPKLELGEIGVLKVIETTRIGAFLDFGLDKDLLLPFKEQKVKVQKGKEYIVGLYIDKSKRLCATMDISEMLLSNSPYKEDDKIKGIIYSVSDEFGAFVAVDNKYYGRIPKHEIYGEIKKGDEVEAYVTKVKEDGKLDLSLREKAYKLIDEDSQLLLDKMNLNDGSLNLNDKSSPDEIRNELNISKNAFKRAVGRLLKEGKIIITDSGIKLK